MRRALGGAALVLAITTTGGCNLPGGSDEVRPSGSTAYFFAQLDFADANADYFTLPRSLADTLPNRTYRGRGSPKLDFSWTERVVVGRVKSVAATAQHRVRLRIEVEQSYPATERRTLDVLVAALAEDRDRYLASAASLDRVVVGIDSYRDDDGDRQTVVAMASQLIGVVDDGGVISYPVLTGDDFLSRPAWDRGMTSLDGLRREATAAPSTIRFGG